MIVRCLVAILRACAALLTGLLLLLAVALLFGHFDPLGSGALSVVGFCIGALALKLWAWQHALQRMAPDEVEHPLRPPLWVNPRHRRRRSSAVSHESWGGARVGKPRSPNRKAREGPYTPEYTQETGARYGSRPSRGPRKEGS